MVDNVIAAYEKSMLDILLAAPFETNDPNEWEE
jgi:hypothetical protein